MTASLRPSLTRFSTVGEIAKALRVSKMTVYRLLDSEALPHVRVGRSIRVPTAAVWRYLESQGIPQEDMPVVDSSPTLRAVQ